MQIILALWCKKMTLHTIGWVRRHLSRQTYNTVRATPVYRGKNGNGNVTSTSENNPNSDLVLAIPRRCHTHMDAVRQKTPAKAGSPLQGTIIVKTAWFYD